MSNHGTLDRNLPCPCDQPLNFGQCCQPIISGKQPARTAVALMRSRYSAHVTGDIDYLITTWQAPDPTLLDRAAIEQWAKSCHWQSLVVHSTRKGGSNDQEGWVEFSAYYKTDPDDPSTLQCHHEASYFIRRDHQWAYIDGQTLEDSAKVGRNDPCPCGSGKKFKRCCLST